MFIIFLKALGTIYAGFELEPDAKFEAVELPKAHDNGPNPNEILTSQHEPSSTIQHFSREQPKDSVVQSPGLSK